MDDTQIEETKQDALKVFGPDFWQMIIREDIPDPEAMRNLVSTFDMFSDLERSKLDELAIRAWRWYIAQIVPKKLSRYEKVERLFKLFYFLERRAERIAKRSELALTDPDEIWMVTLTSRNLSIPLNAKKGVVESGSLTSEYLQRFVQFHLGLRSEGTQIIDFATETRKGIPLLPGSKGYYTWEIKGLVPWPLWHTIQGLSVQSGVASLMIDPSVRETEVERPHYNIYAMEYRDDAHAISSRQESLKRLIFHQPICPLATRFLELFLNHAAPSLFPDVQRVVLDHYQEPVSQ